jgi:hypothetical protein
MGVIFLSAIALKGGLEPNEQKEGPTMKHIGMRSFAKKTLVTFVESMWALAVGFVASVLATSTCDPSC